MTLSLYSYFRSSAAYRVRIALNLKSLPHTIVPIHLVRDGGQQFQASYQHINPEARVPAIQTELGVLSQSLAIIEYLDEQYPTPSLLPGTAWERAQIRSAAQLIACDIHPLNNASVLKYLETQHSMTASQKQAWTHHWITRGLQALETRCADSIGKFLFGDQPTLADCCLIPQLYSAERYQCDLTPFPRLLQVYENALQLPAFQQAQPERQIDAE